MSFRWVLHDASGKQMRASEAFASREEAEEWMGVQWSALLAEGAEEVTLMDEGELIYRMGLRAG